MITVDLRSDTLTKPTPEMLEAIMKGSVGDDVFGEDQTTNALQKRVAKMLGFEAALFTCSGTMANQLAIAAQTRPHDEVIVDLKSHIFQFEQGAPAVISGVQLRPIEYPEAMIDERDLELAIRFPDSHHPRSRLLCLEITSNYNGGLIPDFEKTVAICKKARELDLKIHIDGARIWNACIALGKKVTDFTSLCDTMMFCFSKGLGAPIGSILVGDKKTIERAHYLRKGLGGGWRQSGLLAAAANYTLDNHIERLADDHRRAKKLAGAIEQHPDLELAGRVDTNMIFFRPKKGNTETYAKKLTKRGILNGWRHFVNAIRLVTHLNIDDEMIEYTIDNL